LVEEDIPEAVGHLFKSDEVSIESLGEELLFRMESESTCIADAADFDVTGVLGRRKAFGVRTS
jgi:hypothetical protein